MSIINVTSFAGEIRAQLDMQKTLELDGSTAQISSSKPLTNSISSIDLSGAEYGTLLLKDRLNDEGYAYALVTFKKDQISELYTHLENVLTTEKLLASSNPSDGFAYMNLVEELDDREDQLSSFVGSQFHSSEIEYNAVFDPNVGEKTYLEMINIPSSSGASSSLNDELATIEINFATVFASLHNESACAHCIALAQQDDISGDQPAHALSNADVSSGGVNDIDGTATLDTSNVNLEPLRMSTQWNLTGDQQITYSYYDGSIAYNSPYNGGVTPGTPSGVNTHGSGNEALLNEVFEAWDATVDFTFVEQDESAAGLVGEFRVAYTDQSSGAAAFAYGPGNNAVNGDIWFESEDIDLASVDDFNSSGVGSAGFNYFAALHEVGHAVGLSHPFDAGDAGVDDNLPLAQDSMRNTVMTYSQLDRNYVLFLDSTTTPGSVTTSESYRIYASTPMLYDVEIMDAFYGGENDADAAGSQGNTTYSFSNGPETLQTIVDVGGTDTIDASSQTRENVINLNAGEFSSIGIYTIADQKTDLAAAHGVTQTWIQSVIDGLDASASAANAYYAAHARTALYTREDNVAIAHSAVIENAIGGSVNDTITGNAAANIIDGGAGDDRIEGNGGDDTIDGGAGTEDVLVFNDVRANYTINDNLDGTYTIDHGAGVDGKDDFQNIEFLQFTDQTLAWPADTVLTSSQVAALGSGSQGATGTGGTGGGSSGSGGAGVAVAGSGNTLSDVSVATASDASDALENLDNILTTISSTLAQMGAIRNRLEYSIISLTSTAIQTELAIGRIMDADFASEMAAFTKSRILNNAATYVLSTAQMSKANLKMLLQT